MDLNISLYDLNLKNHPAWDDGRFAGDQELTSWMGDLPRIHPPGANMDPWVQDWKADLFRPENIAAWRAALPPDRPNPDRFQLMFDILENHPDVWIYLGY